MLAALVLMVTALLAVVFAFTVQDLGVPSFDVGSTMGAIIMIAGAVLICIAAILLGRE